MYSGLTRSSLRLAIRRSSRVSINHPLLFLRLASPLLEPKASSIVGKQSRTFAMNSITADYVPEPTGSDPKQLGYLPSLKLSDGNEIPMVRRKLLVTSASAFDLGRLNTSSLRSWDTVWALPTSSAVRKLQRD